MRSSSRQWSPGAYPVAVPSSLRLRLATAAAAAVVVTAGDGRLGAVL